MSGDISTADLGPLGSPLGAGAEAVVIEAPSLRLDDVAGELVYKQYLRSRAQDPVSADVVAARIALPESRRDRLDAGTAWPIRRVVDGDELRGVVLPRISSAWLRTMTLPGTGERSTDPRDAQGLMSPAPTGPNALGLTAAPDHQDRLRICRDLAAVLQLLHDDMDLAYGDLSARNVLVRFEGRPRVLLLDCDAARPVPSTLPPLHTPDWDPPEGGPATTAADVYKLGLFVLRALTPFAWSSVNRDPSWATAALDPDGFDLLRRSLHQSPDARPRAVEWVVHLSRLLGDAVEPPRFVGCGLATTLVAPGDTTVVLWVLDRAAEVTVTAGGRVIGRVDARSGPGRLEVTPPASGVLRLHADNGAGRDDRVAGAVSVMNAQSIVEVSVPIPRLATPALPELPAAPLVGLPPAVYGSMSAAFPPLPAFPAASAPVAAAPSLPEVPWWIADPLAVPRPTSTRRGASR